MRIAFFGGSFDPPHAGHLAIARAAQQALHLDIVLFAPVALQPLKPAGSSASFEDRAAMIRLAIAHQPNFELSLIDAPIPGSTSPNYTVETLLRLRQSLPADDELYLLLGFDSFLTLSQWHRAAEVPFLANLIVASRPAGSASAGNDNALDAIHPAAIDAALPAGVAMHSDPGHAHQYGLSDAAGRQATLHLLPDLHYDVSATELRQAIHSIAPQDCGAIPASVLAYIHEHQLYR